MVAVIRIDLGDTNLAEIEEVKKAVREIVESHPGKTDRLHFETITLE